MGQRLGSARARADYLAGRESEAAQGTVILLADSEGTPRGLGPSGFPRRGRGAPSHEPLLEHK